MRMNEMAAVVCLVIRFGEFSLNVGLFGSLGNCVTIFGKFRKIFAAVFAARKKKGNYQNCVLFFDLLLRWFWSFPVNIGHAGVWHCYVV